jgi:ABC-type uncharacterized transport system permease subunit
MQWYPLDLHFITATFYLLAALIAWVPHPLAVSGVPVPGETPGGRYIAVFGLLLVGSGRHVFEVLGDLFASTGFNLSFAISLSLIVAITMLIYTVMGAILTRADLVARFLAPFAAVVAILPVLMPAQHVLPYGSQPMFKVHFIVAMLAYALFTVATLHALLMTVVEGWLHRGDLPAAAKGLPPLMQMEKLLFRLLLGAFALLTFTLASGMFFSEMLFGKPFQFNGKTIFGLLSWAIFAWLLYGHWKFGWRGKKAVRLTLVGFVMLLMAYVGTKFAIEILLGRV